MSALPRLSPVESVPPRMDVLPGEDELPYDFGEQMESDLHRSGMFLLIETLQLHVAARQDIYVAGNMAIYFSARQIKTNDFRGPDVFVVKNTTRRARKSWVVWQEEALPCVVIELLSESTRKVDLGEKMYIYSRSLGVHEYYLFDPNTVEFFGYRRDPKTGFFVEIPEEEDGDLACRELGLRLGAWNGSYHGLESTWLRWKAPDGTLLPTKGEAESERADAESERADAESERADAESERANAESERAGAEAARAAAAEMRAQEEAARAAEATAQAAALAAELAALRAQLAAARSG